MVNTADPDLAADLLASNAAVLQKQRTMMWTRADVLRAAMMPVIKEKAMAMHEGSGTSMTAARTAAERIICPDIEKSCDNDIASFTDQYRKRAEAIRAWCDARN